MVVQPPCAGRGGENDADCWTSDYRFTSSSSLSVWPDWVPEATCGEVELNNVINKFVPDPMRLQVAATPPRTFLEPS